MTNSGSIPGALACLRAEGVLAYPTEAVYGLGCDPRSLPAIDKILSIKSRPAKKGLILIGSQIEHFDDYCDWQRCSKQQLLQLQSPTQRPTTWLVPAKASVSERVRGHFDSVAIRITQHPLVLELCQQFSHCIVSTSANLAGEPSITEMTELNSLPGIDYILEGSLGQSKQASQIIDLLSSDIIRS
ncbi:L-threonylcarbamoyladenylate synthase type 1 TsaC [Alginatibacterium sediminis]|uniref:Threonylcarbamoyl-AMP synthase n=1 Tax=Alginatibacterium sediminis TaxID=2164068 RepID=A0A420EMX7_9ALTE|nr:Sua5/YciO/YrdC/YwlC family protein [Alginatibacterium sediminis]RKF22075.1 L-threonylcarbamoyladenylate synthase type 1 TsaC [Alginatibacterium sediminis]